MSDTPITDIVRAMGPEAFAASVKQWLERPLRKSLTPFWATLTPEQQRDICLEAAKQWSRPLKPCP